MKLQIIIGSIRPGRVGLPVATWFHGCALEHGAFDVELIDLAEENLPLMQEPNHPRLRQYTLPHTFAWSEKIDSADAYVFVTPEYNHGLPAALKNAIDYLSQEWQYKPVGFVSYGGTAAGARSADQLIQVVTTLKMMPMFETVSIPFVANLVKDGELKANEIMGTAAGTMLNELYRWAEALAPLRARR